MLVYIDAEYKVYTESTEGRTAVETSAFDGKCKAFIEGYRFVPSGHEWKRADGVVFRGEMVTPWKDYNYLAAAQQGYEESLAEMQDMQTALNELGVNANG